jgi:hypothetical protein
MPSPPFPLSHILKKWKGWERGKLKNIIHYEKTISAGNQKIF